MSLYGAHFYEGWLKTPAAAPDNPPFGSRGALFWAIIAAWQVLVPNPQLQAKIQQEGVAAEIPVLSSRPWLPAVVASWEPAPQTITPRRLLPQGQPEDNPPFGSRPWLGALISTWETVPPIVLQSRGVPQGAAAEGFVSSSRPWLYGVLNSWVSEQRTYQRSAPVAAISGSVDNPPFGMRPWLPGALSCWIPPDPKPIVSRPLSPGIPGMSVDAPPVTSRSRLPGILEIGRAHV